jgi:DNA-binding transcriptional LysR family regulator
VPAALSALNTSTLLPRLQLHEARILALSEQLVNGDLDAILTLFTPDALEVLCTARLVLEQVGVERVFLVGAPGTASRRSTWQKLQKAAWILPPTTYSARLRVQQAFLQAGLLPPEPRFESISIPAMLALARGGFGITPAFESTVRQDLASGILRRIYVEPELEPVSIGFAYRSRTADVVAIQSLRDAVRQVVAKPGLR